MRKTIFFCIWLLSLEVQGQQLPGFSSQSSPQSVCEGLSFNSDEDAFKKVKEICDAMDIAGNFMVSECNNVDNCKAVLNNSGSYIFYNNNYLKKIKGLNFTEASFKSSATDDWDVLFILAHEIGHHVLQHLANFQQLSRIMPLVDMELEADKFAGACMFRLGATLEQAQHVMYDASISEKASLNHPGRKERLDMIAMGYNKARAKSQGIVTPPTSAEKVSEAITKLAEGKYDEAVSELERNADNPESWGYLGYAYCSGTGVPKNIEKGIMYYTKAADAGDAFSQYNLATTYLNGEGVAKDEVKALKYYLMCAEEGDTNALIGLGTLY
ncbi:MAG TPA: sel1 repeat family protein, partial [Chitinophagaceae bacterium]|nr:sel1 repeat family protein [Chitinophagaceae bacterium]